MTKLINHYLLNDSWCLVDLPGYGFAKTAGKDARECWIKFTKVGRVYVAYGWLGGEWLRIRCPNGRYVFLWGD